jgi:uncharacterized protein (TIGR02453 family)
MTFEGFPVETFRYLTDLTLHNDKSWFDANRKRYESLYLAPAIALIEVLGPRLQSELPGDVQYEARVNGSLFRINRDLRFSKDKTPYKNHIDMWFWQGGRKGWASPGYYMRLLPDLMILGAGMHQFGKADLDAFRHAVVDEVLGTRLVETVTKVEKAGPYAIGGESRKKVPRGFDADHPRAGFLLHEGLHATLEQPVPPEAHGAGFVDYCLAHYKAMSPINAWLSEVMRAVPDG